MIFNHEIKIGLGCGVGGGLPQPLLEESLKLGCRYFDTSSFYAVGSLNALKIELSKLAIARSDVHLSLKLWVTDFGRNRKFDYESIDISIENSIEHEKKRFGVDFFDSIVIHWPLKVDEAGYPDEFIVEEVWPQLELLVSRGVTKQIGVSNFNIIEIQKLLSIAKIKPCMNQIEFNPYANNQKLVEFCLKNSVTVVGHSPFHFGWKDGHLQIFSDPVISSIANKYDVTPAQVIIAWVLSKNVIPIPGTKNILHLKDLIEAKKICFTYSEIKSIDSLNKLDFNYLSIYDYFGLSFNKKYSYKNIVARFLTISHGRKEISVYESDFLNKIRTALEEDGFIVLPKIFEDLCETLRQKIISRVDGAGRWDGMGTGLNSIINSGDEIIEMLDDPVLGLIVESILGWDCKLDNIAASTSRVGEHASIFGPHQDSPFEQNPGCPLPPPSYPLVLQAIVAIDDFTDNNGPLYVVPGSHKKRMRVNLPWMGNQPKGVVPNDAIKAIVPAGSVVLAIGHIWHGTGINETKSPRVGLLMEFISSVCESRDKFQSPNISDELLKKCSRRVVRLLNNGKMYFHDIPHLLNRYQDLRLENIPDFAKKNL
jgi:diketogulonate reductase-like aldo/keto reductase